MDGEISKPKIVTGVLSKRANFSLDSNGTFYFVGGGNAGVYGISLVEKSGFSYEYIIGLLNSSLLDWFVKKKSSRFHNGYFSYAKRFIESLPIMKPNSSQEKLLMKEIEILVTKIITKTKTNLKSTDENLMLQQQNEIKKIESELDKLVYDLYGITEDERKII